MAVTIPDQSQVFVGVAAGRELSAPAPLFKNVGIGFLASDESASLLLKVHDRASVETEGIAQLFWNADVAVGLNSGVHAVKVGIPAV